MIYSHLEIVPKRPKCPEELSFKHSAQRAADHLSMTIDGKSKAFGGENSTYVDVKNILKNVQKSGYFDKAAQPDVVIEDSNNELEAAANDPLTSENIMTDGADKLTDEEGDLNVVQDYAEAPAAAAVPVPTFPPQHQLPTQPQQHQPQPSIPPAQLINAQSQQIVQQIPMVQPIVPVVGISGVPVTAQPVPLPQPNQIHPSHLAPTTVRAVEQAYFKQHQYMQQQQQPRPVSELIGARTFFFLQDSELDSPDVLPGYQQQPPNSQISPTPAVQQQQHPHQTLQQQQTQIIQQQPQIQSQPQQQIPVVPQQVQTQSFNNQSFPNIVSAPIFTIKPGEVPQTHHIPGFAAPNAPIPIPLVQPSVVSQHQPPQNSSTNTASSNQLHGAPSISVAISSTFPKTGTNQLKSQTPPNTTKDSGQQHHQQTGISKDSKLPEAEQRVPEITEWKPEDATDTPDPSTIEITPDDISEWRGGPPFLNNIEDINIEEPDDLNTWSNSQRYNQYNRNGYNRGNRGLSSRTSGGNSSINSGSSGSGVSTNGFRNRSNNNSYQQNGGRQSGGGGTVRDGGNTFYRNNDNYYQNGSGSGGERSGSNYRGGDRDRDNKDGSSYRGSNSYRSRDSRDSRDSRGEGNTALRGSVQSGSSLSTRNNRQNNNELGTNQSTNSRQSSTNPSNRNVGSGGNTTTTTTTTATSQVRSKPAAGNVYGGGPRPSGNTRPQQSINT